MSIVPRLRAALPEHQIVTDPDEIAKYSHDHASPGAVPEAAVLIFAESTDDVSLVLRVASDLGVPVVPQGSRTGLTRGANAVAGCVLLNLERMTRIIEVNPVNQTARVQAGVIMNDISVAAQEHGLFFPPDPGSVYLATIGGALATNAGGMRCVKYGTTGSFARSLTVVLGTGEVLQVGHDTVKGVAGYDLKSLFIGSEGTLGIITEATVALLPLPGEARTLLATFPSVGAALEAANVVMALPNRPSAVELLDGPSARAIAHYQENSLIPADAGAVLIVESDTHHSATDDIAAYNAVIAVGAPEKIVLGTSAADAQAIMDARRDWHFAMYAMFTDIDSEDVAVPRDQLLAMLEAIDDARKQSGAPIVVGGHAGDGNLHPLIGYDSADPASVAAAEHARDLIMESAVNLGGTISGEHGIGELKLNGVMHELGARTLELQAGVKQLFDPRGILNPGKKF